MHDGSAAARPDLFRFPPETTFRFYALVAALFGAFTFVWSWLCLNIPAIRAALVPKFQACVNSANALPESQRVRGDAAMACVNAINLSQGFFVLACLAATAFAVLLVHLLRPIFIIAHQRLQPLEVVADPEELPPFRAALDALISAAGLRRAPRILIRPRAMNEAFTFGSWFRNYLCLDSGLVGEFFVNRPAFDATIRHELAHFRNRDINKEGLTRTSWWLFLLITPPVLLYCVSANLRYFNVLGPQAWRFALVVGAVYVARNAVIRAREFDADARAYTWDGPDGALINTLERGAAQAPHRWRLPGIFRLHPLPAERVKALHTPGSLLRAGTLLLPAVIGLAFGIGEPPLQYVLVNFTQARGDPVLGGTIAASVFLLPLAGWAGVAIWRDAFGTVQRGRIDLLVAALGLAAAVGILAGFRLSFMTSVSDVGLPSPAVPILVLTLFFLWVRAGAYWWLSSDLGCRRVMASCWFGMAIGGLVLIAAWAWASRLHSLLGVLPTRGQLTQSDVVMFVIRVTISEPATLMFFLLLWGFVAIPRWIGWPSAERRRLLWYRTRQVLIWVVAFAAILVAGRLYVRFTVEPSLSGSEGFRIWFFYVWLEVGALMQGGLALFLALRRPQATLSEACFLTLLAGLLMAVVTLGFNLAFGGSLDAGFAVSTLCQYATAGALVALPMATLGAAIRFMVAGFRPLKVAGVG